MRVKIGVDTGNKNMKTVSQTFVSGIISSLQKPVLSNEWIRFENDAKYYALSNERINYMRDKTVDERFMQLTYIAIAKEIMARKLVASSFEITLGVGLPPEHLSVYKDSFTKYFKRDKYVKFEYAGRAFNVMIDTVMVFPQGYSAAIKKLQKEILTYPTVYVIDIGGYTMDVIEINRGTINLRTCQSKSCGVIEMYNNINKALRLDDVHITEDSIDSIINGDTKGIFIPERNIHLVRDLAKLHVDRVFTELHEEGYSLKSGFTAFIGGGSMLLRPYIKANQFVGKNIIFNDTNANAKGYEAFIDMVKSA